ncbi:MAG: S8 family serine peptidase [Acidobacteriota bacterium]|nr:S8 family serine peptidase [Acidobacteriota bacterium]
MSLRLPVILLCALASIPGWAKSKDYALILSDPPLAERVASRNSLLSAESSGHRAAIATKQNTLHAELSRRKIHVTGSAQTLVNAIFVRVPDGRADELKSIPGVRSVAYLPPLRRHLDRAVNLTQVPAAWNLVGGVNNAGTGVKIAILDTGIDQSHPAFQDSSLAVPSGFPKGQADFTNRKVIVARSYVAQLPFATVDVKDSKPDDTSPRDRVGHGTAMAMIAAGQRTTGPVATITGVAPKAFLGNYKIYGSPGVNDKTTGGVMIQALEDALADGMDIAAIATGDSGLYGPLDRASSCAGNPPVAIRPYIPADACDIRAQAVENAVKLGLTVVVSAGDDGGNGVNFPTLGTINTPGTAPSAITVGATTNSHILFSSVRTGGNAPSNLQQIDAMTGSGPKPGSPLTAPLRDVSQLGNDGLACTPLTGGSLTGAIALIQRGTCPFEVKVNNAQKAGAVAVLLYQASGVDTLFTPTALGGTAIPLFFIGNTRGAALQTFIRANPNATVTLDAALHSSDAPFDTVADFSSRGPSIGTLAIKPELVAVGTDLYTATQRYDPNGDLYDPTGYTAVSGNSFSVPLVAGAVALVKQAHPGYNPAQLKSAVVNTATTDVRDGSGQARATAVGSGKLNAAGAVTSNVTVDPATLSFGAINSGALPLNRTLNLVNTGPSAVTVAVSITPRDTDNNARLSVSPASLPLNPGQSGTVTVRLDGNRPNPGSYEGQIAIAGASTSIHVPYLYLVGSGVAQNIFSVLGDGNTGAVGEDQDLIGFRLLDQFGVPVTDAPVTFRATSGGGQIDAQRGADTRTDIYGIAAGFVILGSQPGDQVFTATAGSLTQDFILTAKTPATIASNGVVNAASFQVGRGLAPGSYITINGVNLSPTSRSFVTPYLPISLLGVSVSFDVPSAGISVPGRISYASDTQINVQIPWELRGQSSASMKVTIDGISSALYTVPLSDYSPALFEFTDAGSGQLIAAAVQGPQIITSARPAQRGQVVSLYANGLGPVNNQPASGEPSPAQPLADSRVLPTVTIGGRQAPVSFSGLAPGFVGLYQLNVTVPADASAGLQPVVVTVNGIDSKTSNLFLN